jgi:hypothetical protein
MDPGFRRDSESGSCQFFILVRVLARPHRETHRNDRRRWVSLSLNPSYKSIALNHLGSQFGGRLATQIGLSRRPRMTAAYALEAGPAGGIGHRSKNPTGNSV